MSDPSSPEQSRDKVWDVLLARAFPNTQPCDWPDGKRIQLDPDLWVGRSDWVLSASMIMDACEPAGYWHEHRDNGYRWQPTRQFAAYYAVVNTNPDSPDDFNWDPDQRLLHCVAFSRTIHPTAIDTAYAARLVLDENDEIKGVYPFSGQRTYTVNNRPPGEQRHWLNVQEWGNVSELLGRWPSSAAHSLPRINRAIRFLEETAREYSLDNRYERLVRTAEALWGESFGKSKRPRGARFKSGLKCLASEYGIDVSENEVSRAWQYRSCVTHGVGLPQPPAPETLNALVSPNDSDVIEPYMKVERVLRKTVQRAITDDDFAARFKSDTSLDDWLTNTE